MDGLAKILEAQTKDKEPQLITGDWTNNISVSDMFSTAIATARSPPC